MPSKLEAKCPCCEVEANNDINIIEEIFGFRNMGNGQKKAQSYCRKCRSLHCSPSNKKCDK